MFNYIHVKQTINNIDLPLNIVSTFKKKPSNKKFVSSYIGLSNPMLYLGLSESF